MLVKEYERDYTIVYDPKTLQVKEAWGFQILTKLKEHHFKYEHLYWWKADATLWYLSDEEPHEIDFKEKRAKSLYAM